MTRYIDLAEYFWLAEQVTGIDTTTLLKASRVELADSALHAPAAGFGDDDFHPDLYDKAAVLTCRLAWNHPLPDGNKRAAWAALSMFVDLNGGHWTPDPPDTDEAVNAMIAINIPRNEAEWVAYEEAIKRKELIDEHARARARARGLPWWLVIPMLLVLGWVAWGVREWYVGRDQQRDDIEEIRREFCEQVIAQGNPPPPGC